MPAPGRPPTSKASASNSAARNGQIGRRRIQGQENDRLPRRHLYPYLRIQGCRRLVARRPRRRPPATPRRGMVRSDADESKVKKMIASLDGIYIRTFEFKDAGAWSPADLEGVRQQLRGAEWSRIVGVKSGQEGENAEIYVRSENKKINGVAILVSSPKELTIVNIVGPVDLDSLASLGGHLGIPKVEITKHK